MSVIDLAAARERLTQTPPPNPILEALDTLALALAGHGHVWTDREHQLYETAAAYIIGSRTGFASAEIAMTQPAKVYAFEGEVTQFLPGKRACFVTLAQPIGGVRRALLHATTVNPAYIDSTTLQLHDHVKGKLVLGDASIAEVVELT